MRSYVYLAAIFSFLYINQASALTCERNSMSTSGFKTKGSAETWYPKELYLDDNKFKPKPNSEQMAFRRETSMDGGVSVVHMYYLLPNGKLISAVQGRSGYKNPGKAWYKCNMKSGELKEKLASTSSTSRSSTSSNSEDSTITKCTSLALQNCSDEELCGMATRKENNLVVWETRGSFGKYANEAKKRSLDCGVATSQSINSNTKIENAEKKCTEIGYTKGTEKYADCVMKLM